MIPPLPSLVRTRSRGSCLAASLLVATLAAACTSSPTIVVWEKPGASKEEGEAARQACLEELEAKDRDEPGINRTAYEANSSGTAFVDCMAERGYTWRTEKADVSSE